MTFLLNRTFYIPDIPTYQEICIFESDILLLKIFFKILPRWIYLVMPYF